MANRDKKICKRLSELIEWYDPEFKFPTKTAKDILRYLKNTIENSNCPTCGESDDDSDDDDNKIYEFEKVLQKKKIDGVEHALVKWRGCSNKYNEWIPVSNL